jgi:hypothetical protein
LNQLFYAVFHSSGVTEIIRKIPCIKLPFNCGHDGPMIDWWLFNVQWNIFKTRLSSTILKTIQKWNRDGTTGAITFDCHCKSWLGRKNVAFCSGYNVPILFQNQQKRSLICREHGTLQTCYLLWSMVRFSRW